MNAHHCCIVFTHDYDTAKKKLEEILQDKLSNGIDNLIRIWNSPNSGNFRYLYEDEEWVWVNPSMGARGYRAHKAYVDAKCTYQEVEEYIRPYCASYCKDEDFHFFNWGYK
jgi:phage terminase large subunit-like protein